MVLVQENQLPDIQLRFKKDKEKLEKLYVKKEEEIFKQELITVLEAITLEITNIQSIIEALEKDKNASKFISDVAKKYDRIQSLASKLGNLAISFKEYRIAELIIKNFYTNSTITIFALCYRIINNFCKLQRKTTKEELIELIYLCSQILELTKDKLYNSSKEYLYNNLTFFTSVVLYINHKTSTVEDKIDKGLGQNNYLIKQKTKEIKTKLINVLSSIIGIIKDREKDITITIVNVDWKVYKHFAKALGEASWCRLSYLDGVFELMSPGIPHERTSRAFDLIVTIYCINKGIKCYSFGSADIDKKGKNIPGKQPDASFSFNEDKTNPDLAIECNYNSGSIKDLDIYLNMEISEVWMYDPENQTRIYHLLGKEYNEMKRSQLLPDFTSEILNKMIKLSLTGSLNDLSKLIFNFP